MPIQTLIEYAKDLDGVARPIVENFARSSDIMEELPFLTFSGGSYETYREAAMPTGMAFRGINEPSGSGRGEITPYQESSFPMDFDIPVDIAIIRRHGMERRAVEEKLTTARWGRYWATTFLDGDNTTEPREFNGIKKRIAMAGASTAANTRTLHNSASSGGAALSLSNLDMLLNMVSGATHLLMPRAFAPRLIAAARNTSISGFVIQTWDQVGLPKMSYAGRKILFGYERELEGDLLNFDEVAAGGGSAVTCSIYAMKFGEDGLHGIQLQPFQVEDQGLLEDRITYNTHVSADVGLADEHPFCMARLTSVTNAAIVT